MDELTPDELDLLKRLIRPQAGKIAAEEFDLRISLWHKLVEPRDVAQPTKAEVA